MAVSFFFEKKIAHFLFEGRQTLEETKIGLLKAFDDPDFPLGANILIDARLSEEKRNLNELAALASLFGSQKGKVGLKAALIIDDSKPNQSEYERILASFSDRYHVRFFVFYNPEDAKEWFDEDDLPAHES